MIPRARMLSEAFWWGRRLERFYLTYRMLLANEYFDLQSGPGYSQVSRYGWGLLVTGQYNEFLAHAPHLDRLSQWNWWTNQHMPYGMPVLYDQLRQGLRGMRSGFRAEWFEQWSRYQEIFQNQEPIAKDLEHPLLLAASQLYPMMLGLLEIEQGRTSLTCWMRLGIEWERLDMTLRLLVLYAGNTDAAEASRLLEWINFVQDASKQVRLSAHDWLSSRSLLRALPSLYARVMRCIDEALIVDEFVFPVPTLRCELTHLLDYQAKLAKACTAFEDLLSIKIQGGVGREGVPAALHNIHA
ncbi:MAG: alpha-E domain-containing protein [Pseudomonadota bacterium]